MKNLFTILLIALVAFSAQAEVCTITLSGDWSASSLRIKEPNGGVDTTITATCDVYFRGTGNTTFLYLGVDGVNTFEYNSCAGYSFISPLLTNNDIYISSGVLPVELTYFNATLNENLVELKWQTASEENNDYFVIERSSDGKTFRTIGTMQGNGTTTEIKDYYFIDRSPSNGTNYYRLKQVDYNGQFEYSKIVSLKYEGKALTISTTVTNTILFTESVTDAKLYDFNGKLVKTCTGTQMTIAHIPVGVYFLRANEKTYKILKM